MKTDAALFLAYAYGEAIGMPASAVLDLPMDELMGFVAYRKLQAEMIDGN